MDGDKELRKQEEIPSGAFKREIDRLHDDIEKLSGKVESLERTLYAVSATSKQVDELHRLVHGDTNAPGIKADVALFQRDREQQARDRRLQWTLIIVLVSSIAAEWLKRVIP